MMLTTKGRYAIMAMAYMGRSNSLKKPCTLQEISDNQKISISYLEQIFAKLRKDGIVVAIKGPGGGYILSKPSKDIYLSEIISAANESIKMTKCDSHLEGGCTNKGVKCITHNLWDGLTKHIDQYFRSISLEDLCSNKLHLEKACNE